MRLVRANVVATVLLGAALAASVVGCELIASVDSSLAAGTGGAGGATPSSSATGGLGGATATTSASTSTGGMGGATTSTTSSGTGGMGGATSSTTTATSSSGTGGAEGDGGPDSSTDGGEDSGTDGGDSGACTATEKLCNGACVAIDDPLFGCGTMSCSPCAAAPACQMVGACDTNTNACTHVAVTNGTACNDGNACTLMDTCQGGSCTGSSPVTCTALDACHLAGTCNPATGVCSNPTASDNTSCTDSNACTLTATCQTGTCTASSSITCTALDLCHFAGTCNPATGVCSNPTASDNTSCTDSNACTLTATCQTGTCTASSSITCTALDPCHFAGTCNPATGVCSNPTASDNTPCTDSNACTLTAACQTGTCTASSSITCTALDPCHVAGTCNPSTGVCSNPTASNGTSCTDVTECGLIGSCQAGACTGACSSGLCGTSLSAFTGTKTAAWSFNGNAHYDAGTNTAVLVDGTVTSGQAGTVIYQDAITADTFTVSFDFLMNTSGPYSRADGIAFMIEKNGSTALGTGFGGFGVLGLNGYAAELDIFDSNSCNPGNGNHAGIDLLAACSSNNGIPNPIATSADLYTPVDAGNNGVGDLGDGQWRTATVTLANSQLSVSITDPSTGSPVAVPSLQNVALPSFVPGTPYYFGFGAGSGSNGNAARQEIRNVAVTFGTTRCL